MNRRGHLSTKLPNVKLRPAPAASVSRARQGEASTSIAADDELLRQAWGGADTEDAARLATGSVERPWKSVVITFTGIENKVNGWPGQVKIRS